MSSKYTPKRTKLHHFIKKILGGGGACPRTPLATRGAKRRTIHPASGMYISPRDYPPMFEHGFTPLVTRAIGVRIPAKANRTHCALNNIQFLSDKSSAELVLIMSGAQNSGNSRGGGCRGVAKI